MIRSVRKTDVDQIAEIYNHYILNTVISFEEEPVSGAVIENRIDEINQANLPWFVAESENRIVGYAFACKWKGRSAYRFSAEVGIYLSPDCLSKGWGTKLYKKVFAELRKNSVHSVMGGIALPNPGSIALHEKFGMEKVAHFKEIGYKFGKWIDVAYWQLTLEDSTVA